MEGVVRRNGERDNNIALGSKSDKVIDLDEDSDFFDGLSVSDSEDEQGILHPANRAIIQVVHLLVEQLKVTMQRTKDPAARIRQAEKIHQKIDDLLLDSNNKYPEWATPLIHGVIESISVLLSRGHQSFSTPKPLDQPFLPESFSACAFPKTSAIVNELATPPRRQISGLGSSNYPLRHRSPARTVSRVVKEREEERELEKSGTHLEGAFETEFEKKTELLNFALPLLDDGQERPNQAGSVGSAQNSFESALAWAKQTLTTEKADSTQKILLGASAGEMKPLKQATSPYFLDAASARIAQGFLDDERDISEAHATEQAHQLFTLNLAATKVLEEKVNSLISSINDTKKGTKLDKAEPRKSAIDDSGLVAKLEGMIDALARRSASETAVAVNEAVAKALSNHTNKDHTKKENEDTKKQHLKTVKDTKDASIEKAQQILRADKEHYQLLASIHLPPSSKSDESLNANGSSTCKSPDVVPEPKGKIKSLGREQSCQQEVAFAKESNREIQTLELQEDVYLQTHHRASQKVEAATVAPTIQLASRSILESWRTAEGSAMSKNAALKRDLEKERNNFATLIKTKHEEFQNTLKVANEKVHAQLEVEKSRREWTEKQRLAIMLREDKLLTELERTKRDSKQRLEAQEEMRIHETEVLESKIKGLTAALEKERSSQKVAELKLGEVTLMQQKGEQREIELEAKLETMESRVQAFKRRLTVAPVFTKILTSAFRGDYLDFRADVDAVHFLQQCGDSVNAEIQFADFIQDFNNSTAKMRNSTVVITDESMIIMTRGKPKIMRERILFDDISAVSLSRQNSSLMIIHHATQHDVLITSAKRAEIIYFMQKTFENIVKEPFPYRYGERLFVWRGDKSRAIRIAGTEKLEFGKEALVL